jgi:hypothetical protein
MKVLFLASALLLPSITHAQTFECSGEGEEGKVKIEKLIVDSAKREILLTVLDVAPRKRSEKKYILTDWHRNGITDAGKAATFVGGTVSGDPNDYSDDISIPHLGVYKSGLGSEITFRLAGYPHGIVGVISCQ